MKESDLASAIDRAARQKAETLLLNARSAVEKALSPFLRPEATGKQSITNDINLLLQQISQKDNSTPKPSVEMLEACRAAMVNELLNGLPKLRELALMATEQSDDSE